MHEKAQVGKLLIPLNEQTPNHGKEQTRQRAEALGVAIRVVDKVILMLRIKGELN